MNDCIFCQIGKHEAPAKFILETKRIMVFPDINPAAAIHWLIVPKKHIEEFMALAPEDKEIWEEMIKTAKNLIREHKLVSRGYRIVINGGGAQLIDHLHLHLMGKIKKERKL